MAYRMSNVSQDDLSGREKAGQEVLASSAYQQPHSLSDTQPNTLGHIYLIHSSRWRARSFGSSNEQQSIDLGLSSQTIEAPLRLGAEPTPIPILAFYILHLLQYPQPFACTTFCFFPILIPMVDQEMLSSLGIMSLIPKKFYAGFDNEIFSRSARLFPEETPIKCRYAINGTEASFQLWKHQKGGAWLRMVESWNDLSDYIRSKHEERNASPDFEKIATLFYSGLAIDDAAIARTTPNPAKFRTTYTDEWEKTVGSVLLDDMMCPFLQQLIINSELEDAVAKKHHYKGVAVHRIPEYDKYRERLEEEEGVAALGADLTKNTEFILLHVNDSPQAIETSTVEQQAPGETRYTGVTHKAEDLATEARDNETTIPAIKKSKSAKKRHRKSVKALFPQPAISPQENTTKSSGGDKATAIDQEMGVQSSNPDITKPITKKSKCLLEAKGSTDVANEDDMADATSCFRTDEPPLLLSQERERRASLKEQRMNSVNFLRIRATSRASSGGQLTVQSLLEQPGSFIEAAPIGVGKQNTGAEPTSTESLSTAAPDAAIIAMPTEMENVQKSNPENGKASSVRIIGGNSDSSSIHASRNVGLLPRMQAMTRPPVKGLFNSEEVHPDVQAKDPHLGNFNKDSLGETQEDDLTSANDDGTWSLVVSKSKSANRPKASSGRRLVVAQKTQKKSHSTSATLPDDKNQVLKPSAMPAHSKSTQAGREFNLEDYPPISSTSAKRVAQPQPAKSKTPQSSTIKVSSKALNEKSLIAVANAEETVKPPSQASEELPENLQKRESRSSFKNVSPTPEIGLIDAHELKTKPTVVIDRQQSPTRNITEERKEISGINKNTSVELYDTHENSSSTTTASQSTVTGDISWSNLEYPTKIPRKHKPSLSFNLPREVHGRARASSLSGARSTTTIQGIFRLGNEDIESQFPDSRTNADITTPATFVKQFLEIDALAQQSTPSLQSSTNDEGGKLAQINPSDFKHSPEVKAVTAPPTDQSHVPVTNPLDTRAQQHPNPEAPVFQCLGYDADPDNDTAMRLNVPGNDLSIIAIGAVVGRAGPSAVHGHPIKNMSGSVSVPFASATPLVSDERSYSPQHTPQRDQGSAQQDHIIQQQPPVQDLECQTIQNIRQGPSVAPIPSYHFPNSPHDSRQRSSRYEQINDVPQGRFYQRFPLPGPLPGVYSPGGYPLVVSAPGIEAEFPRQCVRSDGDRGSFRNAGHSDNHGNRPGDYGTGVDGSRETHLADAKRSTAVRSEEQTTRTGINSAPGGRGDKSGNEISGGQASGGRISGGKKLTKSPKKKQSNEGSATRSKSPAKRGNDNTGGFNESDCAYCHKKLSADDDLNFVCLGCTARSQLRYCTNACRLIHSRAHASNCGTGFYPLVRSQDDLTEKQKALPSPINTVGTVGWTGRDESQTNPLPHHDKYRQRAFSMHCRSANFPPLIATWIRTQELTDAELDHLGPTVDESRKKTGEYFIFKSESTADDEKYCEDATVIFTVSFSPEDRRQNALRRTLNGLYFTVGNTAQNWTILAMELAQFAWRMIKDVIKGPEFEGLSPGVCEKSDVFTEFVTQFQNEFFFNSTYQSPDLARKKFCFEAEWPQVKHSLDLLERGYPVVAAWA